MVRVLLLIIQHIECEGLGLLEPMLLSRNCLLDIRCMDKPGALLPADLRPYQGMIILGGPMSACEENRYPYLRQVQQLVRQALGQKIPTIGICLGAQLIARALEAEVRPNPVKEIGWSHVCLSAAGQANPMFAALPERLAVFQWHGDTFDLPESADLLAYGEWCRNQAFVVQECIWGLQFHLEVTPAMIARWAELYEDELIEYAGPGAAMRLIRNSLYRWDGMQTWREQFLNNVVNLLCQG